MAIPKEVTEKQLAMILDSDVFIGGNGFKKIEQLARLLKHIVLENLAGAKVTENSLLLDFYKIPADAVGPDITTARVDVGRLRKKLHDYRALRGLDDPLLIDIPKGQYNVVFTPNPNRPAQKEVTLGFHHVDRETPSHIQKALAHFDRAIELDKDYAEGYAGRASALLTMTLHAYFEDPTEVFEEAEKAAQRAVELDPKSWRGHANLGAVHLFRHEWPRADAAFNEAKNISPFEIDSIGGYGPYLLARGRYKEALALADRYINEGFADFILSVRAGLYFYALRHYEDAEAILLSALERDEHFWRAHLILAFVYLSTTNPEKALSHMLEVKALAKMNLWPGMRVLCLENAGKSVEAEAEFAELLNASKKRYIQPMQLALGYMALGQPLEAIAFLRKACQEYDPSAAWVHLWPFLDGVRRFPEFRALLRERNFPTA